MLAIALIAAIVFAAVAAGIGAAYMTERRRGDQLLRELVRARHVAAEQDQALSERQKLDTLKDEFIATVSHELRTPLTSIRGSLGLLSAGLMGKMDEKAAHLLRIASSNTDRLVRLINDILDLERMESGKASMILRPCSMRDIVAHSAETMASMASEAGVRIEVVPEPPSFPPAFLGDPDRMQQVLMNLLSNAIKFSPSGTRVLIRTTADAHSLIVQVEDSGRGVPTDKLESIFERFNQVDSADSRQKGGTGLGLAISRTIITQHGGEIWAERNDRDGSGRSGSVFKIRLPRSPQAEASSYTAGPRLVADDPRKQPMTRAS